MLVAVTTATLLAAPSASATQDQPVRSSASVTPPTLSPDRVIVEWAAGASPAERRAARQGADVDFSRDLGDRRFQLVETEPGQAPREAVRELEADPAVVVAERDGYDTLDSVPNDPLFDQLWGLQNTGLGIDDFDGAVAGDDIGAVSAWERTVGTPSTVVAVIDSGYRFEHPDLADVAWTNPGETLDGADNDGNGIVDDVLGADFIGADGEAPATDGDPTDDDLIDGGHGVHVAGTIGAEGNNGIGITGVAQDVRIMPLRACSYFASAGEGGCWHSAAIEAINYAGAKGARAANMSFGSNTYRATFADAIAANPQTLFVVSGGNESEDNDVLPRYPCNYNPVEEGKGPVDNVICVAATDQADQKASFSDWGASSVDLGAPGTQTLSAWPFRYLIDDDFEEDDFAVKWIATGPDGGFSRTNEAPLTSFGISDSPGATPIAGSTRASTSVPITVPAGYQSCDLELTASSPGGGGFFEVLLDGENEFGFSFGSGHITRKLLRLLSGGGEVAVRVSYTAGSSPSPSSGVWIEDVALHCIAQVGEANGYRFANGTSMAAPHVTGAAALLFSLKPSASVTEVRQGLLRSVDPVSSLAGKTTSGGRLDAAAALDLFDGVSPPAPVLSATNPPSPSKNNQPRLIGSAQRGTSIAVYANASCSGSPVAGGTAAQLAVPGIAVTVGDDTTTAFSVSATDLAPHTSTCSAPISYTHVKATTGSGGGDGGPTPTTIGPPPTPTCIVPKLAGKTLARAKAALTRAACKLGTVRKPRPRKGKRLPPLLVKSSAPAAGASPPSGEVNLTLGPKPRKSGRT